MNLRADIGVDLFDDLPNAQLLSDFYFTVAVQKDLHCSTLYILLSVIFPGEVKLPESERDAIQEEQRCQPVYEPGPGIRAVSTNVI